MKYKNRKVIQLQKIANFVTIDWVLGNYCNYKCSYCFPGSNSGNARPPKISPSIEQNIVLLSTEVKKHLGDKILFLVSGGEPTLYHDIENLSRILSQQGHVAILTNGSRSMEWWQSNFHLFYMVIVSFHIETNNYDHILNLLKFLANKIPVVTVHMMIYHRFFNQSIDAYNRIIEDLSSYNVKIIPKVIRDSNNEFVSFTEEQHLLIEKLEVQGGRSITNPQEHLYEYTVVYTDDGIKENIGIKDIKNLTESPNGYKCMAHRSVIQISNEGELGNLTCGQSIRNPCNIFSEDFPNLFSLSKKPILCQQNSCGCTSLILATKQA